MQASKPINFYFKTNQMNQLSNSANSKELQFSKNYSNIIGKGIQQQMHVFNEQKDGIKNLEFSSQNHINPQNKFERLASRQLDFG